MVGCVIRRGFVLIAVAAAAIVCAPGARAGEIAIGVTAATRPDLVLFDTDTPGTLIASRPIAGVNPGELITGVDMRPATGELFAPTSFIRMLSLDPRTGEMSQLAGPAGLATTPAFSFGAQMGVDFNPTVDRLRLVNEFDDNMRFNPVAYTAVDGDGGTGGVQPDADLAFDAGDPNVGADPNVVAEAYSRNDNDPATATTLFGIDPALNILLTQGGTDGNPSPNIGPLFTRGSLGADVTSPAAMDIVPGAPGSPADGVAYLAAVPAGGGSSTLYDVDIVAPSGQLTSLGAIAGAPLAGMTIALGGGVGFDATSTVTGEAASQVVVTVERSGETLSAAAPDGGAVRVPFRTVDRTAVAGRDYTAVSGVLAFAENETSKQVVVPLLGDGDDESAETFGLELGPVGDGAVLLEPEHTIEIADDDSPPPQPLQFLTATKAPRSLKALGRAKRLRLEFSCSNACAATFALALGKKEIGTGSASLAQPGVATATATLSKRGRKAVSKVVAGGRKTAKLTLDGKATDSAGSAATRALKLRVPVR
jgi:hypothetical protein